MISAGPGASRTRSPLRQTEHLRHAGAARQFRMFGQMQRLAVRRDENFRPTQPIMSSNSARRGWPET